MKRVSTVLLFGLLLAASGVSFSQQKQAQPAPRTSSDRRGTRFAPCDRMLAILFWIAVGCILHTYVLYPLLLIVLDGVAQAKSAWQKVDQESRAASSLLPPFTGMSPRASNAICATRRKMGAATTPPACSTIGSSSVTAIAITGLSAGTKPTNEAMKRSIE